MTYLRERVGRCCAHSDVGVAMVTVVGMTVFLTAFMVVAVGTTITAVRSSRDNVSFEQALAVAEAGIDSNLSLVAEAYKSGNPGWTNPSPCALPPPSAADVATAEAERSWAGAQLRSLPPSCLVTTPQGEFVAARSPGRQAVYAVGWSPSRADANAKSRLIKAEYVLAPYAPSKAVLTGGDLEFSGSVTVNHVDPTAPADVHTNADVVSMNNSLNVSGSITATGTVSGSCPGGVQDGCAAGKPLEPLPTTSPRSVYGAYAATEPNWIDLCPDGTARRPELSAGIAGLPCTGPVYTGAMPWNFGWSGVVPVWTYPRTSSDVPGVYYVYQGDAVIGSTGNSSENRNITVIAESAPVGGPADSCGKLGGNIAWQLFSLQPYLSGLALFAEGNLTGGAQADAGPGLFLAGDKVDIRTSSSTITGSVIAANTCLAAGSNTLQGVTISYDQSVEAPVNDIIRTSLWLEYGG